MSATPEYCEETAAKLSRRLGRDISPSFVARIEDEVGKPMMSMTTDDLERALAASQRDLAEAQRELTELQMLGERREFRERFGRALATPATRPSGHFRSHPVKHVPAEQNS